MDPGPMKRMIPVMFSSRDDRTATAEQIQAVGAQVRTEYLAVQLFLGADPRRYGRLLEDTENKFTCMNKDAYPTTVNQAYETIVRYKNDPRNHRSVATKDQVISFVTRTSNDQDKSDPGWKTNPGTKYYNCQGFGYVAEA